jgi:TolA-binding protein
VSRYRLLLVPFVVLGASMGAGALSLEGLTGGNSDQWRRSQDARRRQEEARRRQEEALRRRREEIERLREQRRKELDKRRKEDTKKAEKESAEAIKAAFKKGEEAFREQRYSAAYLHFSSVASCASKSKDSAALVAKAKAKAVEIEAMAEEKYQLGKVLMMKGQSKEAAAALLEVAESFGYCPAAKRARSLLLRLRSTPSVAASLRYSDGKAQEDAENYLEALRIYDEVMRRWPDELAALRARVASKKVRRDPEKMATRREAFEEDADRRCPTLIAMAKSFLMNLEVLAASKGDVSEAAAELKLQAAEKLQRVIREYPGTTYAKRAAKAAEALSKNDIVGAKALLDAEPKGESEEK